MCMEVHELQRKLAITFLYVTYDQVDVMTMADQMVVMCNGYAEQIGTLLEVYPRPETLFVARFIVSLKMNVFDAHLHSKQLKTSDIII